jgi:ribosomal 30S subunit maturation factor RimM
LAIRPIKIASIRYTTDDVYLLGLDQIVDRDIAEKFKNYLVYIRNDKRPDLADDEFLIRDLVGLNCSYQGVNIAAVVGVVLPVDLCDSASLASKMHSLLEIRIHSNKQLCLLPFVPSIVPRVDMKLKIVWIEPPDGLLDLTYEEKVRVVIRGYLPAVATMSAESRKWFETLNTASQICIADSRSRDLESSKAVAAPSTIKRKRTVPSLLAAKRKSLRTPTSSSS